MAKLKNSIKLIGDRILVKPLAREDKTSGGIIIPDETKSSNPIASGIVIQVGPGYLSHQGESTGSREAWMEAPTPESQHVPLQIQPSFKVIFYQEMSTEIEIEKVKYRVMPQAAVLVYDEKPFASGGEQACAE